MALFSVAFLAFTLTPMFLLVKVAHAFIRKQVLFSSRGSPKVPFEVAAWLLLGVLDCFFVAGSYGFFLDPEDSCGQGTGARLLHAEILGYQYSVQCVYPDGSMDANQVPWQVNLTTAVFAVAAVAVIAFAVGRLLVARSHAAR
ncbi:hypothetical protein GCM10009854_08260 [Saccharopolyspora halophila]|uniref:Uncharacterized protein n=2 Tax=Saccharopolyspora halophila TaxID=405551 RepID=A0ABN3FPL9_9PSEU